MRIFRWLAIGAITLCFPLSVFAINLGATELGTAGTNAGINTTGTEGSLAGLVGGVIGMVLNILGALLLILFIYAGFLWMTAQGDDKQVKKAKDIMGNALIGLVLTMIAYSIVLFTASKLPGAGIVSNELTTSVATEAGVYGSNNFLEGNIGAIINVVLNLLGVILLLIFIYAGFLWMTAQGDSKQVDKAKAMMKNALIGLIITLLARATATFVIDQLEGASTVFIPGEIIHNTFHA